jgi:hypothetical protein
LSFAPIAHEAEKVTRKLGLSSDLVMIERAWTLEMGGLKELARIVAIDNSALVVEADSHAVMQEVSLRRRELVRKLNQHFPSPLLNQISVRIAQDHGR